MVVKSVPILLWYYGQVGSACRELCSWGDKTFAHHSVRNDIYGHAKAGGTGPVLEAAAVLLTLGVDEAGEEIRVWSVRTCCCVDHRILKLVAVAEFMGRVALDVGIVCPQAASHLGAAAVEVCGGAEEYAGTKCSRAGMERRCGEVGVVFQPLIFESLGGRQCGSRKGY